MFSSPYSLVTSGLLTIFGLTATARADWPQMLAREAPGFGHVVQAGAQEPLSPMPMRNSSEIPPAQKRDELTEAGLLLPGPAQPTGVVNPQPLEYYYPARSERLFDEVGSQLSPDVLGPRNRPEYPYRATQYWDGHDAFPEAWGDLLELPYVQLGWFFNAELTYYRPRVSADFSSGTGLDGTFPGNPVNLGAADMDWAAAPKIEWGYRYEHGLGELRGAYRYVYGDGTSGLPPRFGGGELTTKLRVHVVDLDVSILEFNAEGMPLIMPMFLAPGRLGLGRPLVKGFLETPLEYRMFFGIRAGTLYYESIGNGALIDESVTNNFSGAGIHFGWDVNQKLPTAAPLFLHWRAEGSGMWGNLSQRFQRSAGGLSAQTGFQGDSIGVPTVELELGLSYVPLWPDRNMRMTLAYRFEEWFSWAHTDDSQAEFYYSGVVARGEWKF